MDNHIQTSPFMFDFFMFESESLNLGTDSATSSQGGGAILL